MNRPGALLALAVFLGACGASDPDPTPGVPAVVLEHSYDDPDTWTTEQCTFRDAKTQVCFAWSTTEHHDGPHWHLRIRQCGHKQFASKKNTDGCGAWWVEVSEATYNGHPDGTRITFQ